MRSGSDSGINRDGPPAAADEEEEGRHPLALLPSPE